MLEETDEIEEKVMYSILTKKTKTSRYILVCSCKYLNEPYKKEYKVTEISKTTF
jgi:KUP system potassium uptake protein